jgi:hypothetical protein
MGGANGQKKRKAEKERQAQDRSIHKRRKVWMMSHTGVRMAREKRGSKIQQIRAFRADFNSLAFVQRLFFMNRLAGAVPVLGFTRTFSIRFS